jgi:hypothetical protein
MRFDFQSQAPRPGDRRSNPRRCCGGEAGTRHRGYRRAGVVTEFGDGAFGKNQRYASDKPAWKAAQSQAGARKAVVRMKLVARIERSEIRDDGAIRLRSRDAAR